MSNFIERNKRDWDELEILLKEARKSRRRMTAEELSRLDVLYRRTTVHLAQVASRTTDRRLLNYLNGLATSAHSIIYLPPRRSIWIGVFEFTVQGFARTVARHKRLHTASALLLLGGVLLGYFASYRDPLATYALLPPGDIRQPGSTQEQLLQVLRHGRDQGGGEKFVFASFLFSHNLKVGILSMATGALAAVPTVLLMLYNGMMLGAFASMHHNAGIYAEFWAWILPHGITELGAIVLCGGVGLLLGKAIVSPGAATRTQSLQLAGKEVAKTCLGIAAMLVFAAIIESYLRQSHLSTAARLTFAAGTAVFWCGYFVYGYLLERRDAGAARDKLQPGSPVI